MYNSVTVICHKWKKPNADHQVEKVAGQRQKRGREGQKRREKRASVCERDRRYSKE